ncbi:hypothetical protein LJY25_06590 [Hymenobacter sp. BT175]|uniref:hypothetical protein n=1 Tax=Hymenobacter translucens TaxID=2886507 RepID=UPI001D0E6A4D|nr:hypothetical protein [Hymenobacter translucens]MCC2546105.1 hypothetical protein [Hymenobacter translucens]
MGRGTALQAGLTLAGLVGFGLLSACNSTDAPARHSRLLGFKAAFIAEQGDEAALRPKGVARKLRTGAIEVKPVHDILYISLPRHVNACGQYEGNIAISWDTIYLRYVDVSDVACASGRIDQLTYLVDNPKHKRYKVVFRN